MCVRWPCNGNKQLPTGNTQCQSHVIKISARSFDWSECDRGSIIRREHYTIIHHFIFFTTLTNVIRKVNINVDSHLTMYNHSVCTISAVAGVCWAELASSLCAVCGELSFKMVSLKISDCSHNKIIIFVHGKIARQSPDSTGLRTPVNIVCIVCSERQCMYAMAGDSN